MGPLVSCIRDDLDGIPPCLPQRSSDSLGLPLLWQPDTIIAAPGSHAVLREVAPLLLVSRGIDALRRRGLNRGEPLAPGILDYLDCLDHTASVGRACRHQP